MKTIKCETKTKISNKVTGRVYVSEAEAKLDIADKMTPTTEEDIRRDVEVFVPSLEIFGDTNAS
tara:strand:+ start:64 stop:255 length:192 start_codon:yes stop_codon:yes gene_type:complete